MGKKRRDNLPEHYAGAYLFLKYVFAPLLAGGFYPVRFFGHDKYQNPRQRHRRRQPDL